MPEHSKFASRDAAHGGPLARQSIFSPPEERDGLALLADSQGGDPSAKDPKQGEIPDITPQILQLLGPLVAPELREGGGALSLEKLAAKEFKTYAAFKKFLCDQAALNDNKVFRNPYESLLEDDYFVDILSLVYEKLNPAATRLGDSKKAALRMLPEFQSRLVAIDAEAFARNLVKNDSGRENLRHLLKHPTFLTKDQKADLIKGIYEVADGAKVLSSWERHTVSSNINPWNYFNLGVSYKNLDAAAIGAEFMVGSIANEEERATEIGQELLEKVGPHFKTHNGEGFEKISAKRVKYFQKLFADSQASTGAKASAVAKLAHLWLWAADERNMQAYQGLSQDQTHQLQHHLMKQAEGLIETAEKMKTREALLEFQEQTEAFLQDPIPWQGENATLNWVSHQLSGESIEDYLGELPEAYGGVISSLKQQNEAWGYSVREMGAKIRIEPWELEAQDPKFRKQLAGMMQGLEDSKHQLWYGYKQHKFISRAGSNVAEVFNSGDIQDIEAAQITLNALMQQLSQVKEPEDLKPVFKDLIEALSDDGTLYQAMQAAEMDGTEQLLGLAQTCGIMMALAAATRGLSLAAEGTGALARFGGMVRSSRVALDGYGKLGTMTEGAIMGAALVTTENALAVTTGEVRHGPETVGKWFKDAIATGAAMGLSAGLLKLPKLDAGAQQNLAKQIWARYTTGGIQGLKHLAADMGIEVIEEATDQYIRQVLDGDYGALTEAEITELTLICFAGGPAKSLTLVEHLKAAQASQAIAESKSDSNNDTDTESLNELKPETPANDNAVKPQKSQHPLPWAAAAGLTAYITDLNLADAAVLSTADVGGAIASQGFWPGLATALGVAAGGVLAMALSQANKKPLEVHQSIAALSQSFEKEQQRLWDRLDQVLGKIPEAIAEDYLAKMEALQERAAFWQEQIQALAKTTGEEQERYAQDIEMGLSLLRDRLLRVGAEIFQEPISESERPQWGLRKKPELNRKPPSPEAAKDLAQLPALKNRDVGFGRTLSLRPHQEKALHQIRGRLALLKAQLNSLASGETLPADMLKGTIVMPVGGGKTRTMVAAFASTLKQGLFDATRGDKLIILNHTDQIHGQNKKVLSYLAPYFKSQTGRSLKISEYKAGQKDLSGDVVVVSIPTVNQEESRQAFLKQLKKQLGNEGKIPMVAIDEVHHLEMGRNASKATWAKLIEGLRTVDDHFFEIGFTATPTGKEGNRLFTLREQELMQTGVTPRTYLVKVKGEDLSQLKVTQSGDFVTRELASTLLAYPQRNIRLYQSLEQHGLKQEKPSPSGKTQLEPTIGFAADLKHAAMMANDYAAYFSEASDSELKNRNLLVLGANKGKVSQKELAQALAKYRRGEIDGIVTIVSGHTGKQRQTILKAVEAGEIEAVFTVDALVEGADLHMFTHQLGARPTFSRIKKAQERGRVNRRSPDELDSQGKLIKDRPKILFEVMDRYASADRALVRYGEVMGVPGHTSLPNNTLFDALSHEAVDQVDREGKQVKRQGLSELAQGKPQKPTIKPHAGEKDISSLQALLQEILETRYDQDLLDLALDLGETEDFVAGLLRGEGWLETRWFLRRMATLLHQERQSFVHRFNELRDLGNDHITPADYQIIQGALHLYETWEGPIPEGGIQIKGEFKWGEESVHILPNSIQRYYQRTLGEKSWQTLVRGLTAYLTTKVKDPSHSKAAQAYNNHLTAHIFEKQGWNHQNSTPAEQLLLLARRGVARRYGGVLPQKIDHQGIPNQNSQAPLTRWLQGQEIQFGAGHKPHAFYEQVRALLIDVLGEDKTRVEAVIEATVFAEQGWDDQKDTPAEQLLLLARRGVARRHGGVLPQKIDHQGIPWQGSQASLTRWLQGQEIQFRNRLSPKTFYDQVRALLIDVLGEDKAQVDAAIEAAVFAEQGWDHQAETPAEQLLLLACRGVARRYGGVLPIIIDHQGISQQGPKAPLTRWLQGQEIQFGRGLSQQNFYNQVRALLIDVLGEDKAKVEAVIEAAVFAEQGWDHQAETPAQQLLLLMRRGVAQRYGGVLPTIIDHQGIPNQNSQAPLTRWLQGQEIQFGASLPLQAFYDQVRALLIDVLGEDKAHVDAAIEAAVFADQGWDYQEDTPAEQLLLLARRGVTQRYGGVLPKKINHQRIPTQRPNAPLTRWLQGQEIQFGRNFPPQKFYAQVRTLLIDVLKCDPKKVAALITEVEKDSEQTKTIPGTGGFGSSLAGLATFFGLSFTTDIANATADVGSTIASQGIWPGILTALGIGAMGLLGMAINQSGTGDENAVLTHDESKKLTGILQKYPSLEKVFSKAGWSPLEKFQLLTRIEVQAKNDFRRAYQELSSAVRALHRAGWSSEQSHAFLCRLAETSRASVYQAYRYLPMALNSLGKTGWSIEQQVRFISLLEEKAEWAVSRAYRYLPKTLEALATTDWTSEEKYQFLTWLAHQTERSTGVAFRDFPDALTPLVEVGWSSEQIIPYLKSITEKTSKSAWLAFDIISLLQQYAPQHFEQSLQIYSQIIDQLNAHNRERVLGYIKENQRVFADLGSEKFLSHLACYAELFKRWPRLGFNLLEGVMEATEIGIIPMDISSHREKIFFFVEKTHGFIPFIYQSFLKEGETLFPVLEKYSHAMIRDEIGSSEVQEIIKNHGEEFLLGLIQSTSPTSGASFVKKNNQLRLMKLMLATGDLRKHIPQVWRHQVETISLTEGSWVLKAGEVADGEGKITELLNDLRVPETEVGSQELAAAITDYLEQGRPAEARPEIQKLLYRLAAQDDVLNEKIGRLQNQDYISLGLLEQLIGDRDNLQASLEQALNQVPVELLVGQGKKKQLSQDPKALIKAMKAVWTQKTGGKDLSTEKRTEILGNMLKAYEAEAIEKKILSRSDINEALKAAIRQVMQKAPDLSHEQIIRELLGEPLALIQSEKQKYVFQEEQSLQLEVRAVKGPVYGLHGLSAGICTAADQMLWRNPNFKLLALSDKMHQQVLGYIQVFEIESDGKKYLTLPGINPTTEFMGKVDAKELYKGMMQAVTAFAQSGDYDGVYIPADSIIHSNRRDIHKIIEASAYPRKMIPIVIWNSLPRPYPIIQVYVAWQKTEEGPKGFNPSHLLPMLGAGLATLLTPDLANATADIGGAIASQGFWPGLAAALGVTALGILGMAWRGTTSAVSLEKFDQDLLAWQIQYPADPKIADRFSLMADQLLEAGDSRGEWIQLALKFDQMLRHGGDPEHMLQILQRQQMIRSQLQEDLEKQFGFKMVLDFEPARGFTLEISGKIEKNLAEFLQELDQSKYSLLVRGLKIRDLTISGELFQEVLQSRILQQLTSLTLVNNGLEAAAGQSLAQATTLKNLQHLNIGGNHLANEGLASLAASSHFPNLIALSLPRSGIGPAGIRALANSPHFLSLHFLGLSENPIGNLGVGYLAGGAVMRALRSLYLICIGMNNEGIRALANNDSLKNLTTLEFRNNETGADANALLRHSPNLPRLTHINGKEIIPE